MLTDLIKQQLSGAAMGQISQLLGVDEGRAQGAVETALPLIIGGLAKNSANEQGAGLLAAALDRNHDGSALDDIVGLIASGGGNGEGILGHVFGDKRGQVENQLSQATGLDSGSAAGLLTALAPVVMGALGRTQREQGLDAGALAGLLGQERQNVAPESPAMAILSGLIDRDHDGSMVDDIAAMGMQALGSFLSRK